MRRMGPRVLLLLFGLLAMLLQAGSIPHLHAGSGYGLYNADHDLTLLASLAAHGLPGDPPRAVIDAVSAPVVSLALVQHAARFSQAAESRAPPLS